MKFTIRFFLACAVLGFSASAAHAHGSGVFHGAKAVAGDAPAFHVCEPCVNFTGRFGLRIRLGVGADEHHELHGNSSG
jgi:hypothetical protein